MQSKRPVWTIFCLGSLCEGIACIALGWVGDSNKKHMDLEESVTCAEHSCITYIKQRLCY